eukprot:136580_1
MNWITIFIVGFVRCANIREPYLYLNGGYFNSSNSYLKQYSPDPIIDYIWNLSSPKLNKTKLQIYNISPKKGWTNNEISFDGINTINSSSIHIRINGPGIISIDFGQESAGWLEIDVENGVMNDKNLMLSLSEYNMPYLDYTSYNKTRKPILLSNNYTFRLMTNDEYYEGIRFGFIIVSNYTGSPWNITDIRCIAQIKPINYYGSFYSSQHNILNKIWYSAAYAVKMNMLPSYYTAILMDRGDRSAWTADAHIAQKTSMYAFGCNITYELIYENMNYTKNQSHQTGNGIKYWYPTFALFWTWSLYDYIMFTGDINMALDTNYNFMYYVNWTLNDAINHFGIYDGSINLRWYTWDERGGAGQPELTNDLFEAQYGYNMLIIQTLLKLSKIYDLINQTQVGNYYRHSAYKFINEIRSIDNWLDLFGLHSSADAINGGWLNETEQNYLFSKWYNDSVLICSYDSFNQYFIVNAMAKMGKMDYVLSTISLCWGKQVDLGATTFWEIYQPFFNDFLNVNDPIPNMRNGYTSYCHPYSSGILPFITEYLLGIQIVEPGFKHIRIKPYLFNINGSIPMYPNNDILLVDINAYENYYRFIVPNQMTIEIYFPLSVHFEDIYSTDLQFAIYLNNHIWREHYNNFELQMHYKKYYLVSKLGIVFEKGHYVFKIVAHNSRDILNNKLGTNKTDIEIPNMFPPQHFPCDIFGNDTNTKGNWMNKYGKDGYILFSYYYNQSVQHVNDSASLPSYLSSVKYWHNPPTNILYVTNTTNENALQNPNDQTIGMRNLGMRGSWDSFAIDLNITKINNNTWYKLSFYFCDFKDLKIRQVLRIMDLNGYNLIAPYSYITNFTTGIWISYKIDRAVRVRMEQIRGNFSSVSAIMFDTLQL